MMRELRNCLAPEQAEALLIVKKNLLLVTTTNTEILVVLYLLIDHINMITSTVHFYVIQIF